MEQVKFENMQQLRSMVAATVPAASTADRADIKGINLAVFGLQLHARAMNGAWAMRVVRRVEYSDSGFNVLVPMSHVRRLLVMIGDEQGPARIERNDAGNTTIYLENIGRIELPVGLTEVKFPTIEHAWPTTDAVAMDEIGLNPSLLADLAKAFGVLTPKPTLKFAFHGHASAVVVTCEEDPLADAVLMPYELHGRSDDDEAEGWPQTELFPESKARPKDVEKAIKKSEAIVEKAIAGIKKKSKATTQEGRAKVKKAKTKK